MKSFKAIQKIDELGRIILPLEMRQILEWNQRDNLLLLLNAEDNTVTLKLSEKYIGPECLFCGTRDSAFEFNSPDICSTCLENLLNSGHLTQDRLDELRAK